MVVNENNLFMCEECDLKYNNEEMAVKCENFCKENKSCSVEITKHAIK